MVIIVGEITIAPGKLDAFLAEVEKIEQITRQEDGCISYAMALDDAATGKIAVSERWRDEAALRTHLETETVKQFVEKCGPMMLSMDGSLYDAQNERPIM